MAMTAAQIVTLACQIAKCPGYTSQAGQMLNLALQDLAQTYNLEILKVTDTFNMATSAPPAANALSATWLRSKKDDVFYTILGVNYFPIQVDQAGYDKLVQQSGMQAYPSIFYVDTSTSPANMYFWAPPSGAYPVTARYYSLPADIATPESSSSVPWFPNQDYLVTRLAGQMMQITDDDRAQAFLADDEEQFPHGAGSILRRYLKLQSDETSFAKTVTLSRSRFYNSNYARLRNTKQIGW